MKRRNWTARHSVTYYFSFVQFHVKGVSKIQYCLHTFIASIISTLSGEITCILYLLFVLRFIKCTYISCHQKVLHINYSNIFVNILIFIWIFVHFFFIHLFIICIFHITYLFLIMLLKYYLCSEQGLWYVPMGLWTTKWYYFKIFSASGQWFG